MSTVAKPQPAAPAPAARPASAPKAARSATQPKPYQALLFNRDNYVWMTVGVALIFIGFLLMSGGKSADPHQFQYDEIYSFRRITLAPIVVLLGFVVEVFAIMKKPNDTAEA
jgi:predicted cobalt transporter CbtA